MLALPQRDEGDAWLFLSYMVCMSFCMLYLMMCSVVLKEKSNVLADSLSLDLFSRKALSPCIDHFYAQV